MLFNSKETDFEYAIHFIDSFMAQSGFDSKICIDKRKLSEVINVLYFDGYYHNGDLSKSSVFKKVAVFVLTFMSVRPIQQLESSNMINSTLSSIMSYENAVLSFEIARESLHNSVIHRQNGNDVVLKNPISISEHSYIEIIDAFTKLSFQNGHLLLAVLFEQMAYRANPDCSYDQIC